MEPGLLLDIGGVVIRTPFELLAAAERHHGLAPGALGARGPFDPDGDPEFTQVLDGEVAERAFWAARAQRAAGALSTGEDTRSFMQALYALPHDEVLRPEIVALINDAKAAGRRVGLLTNDLRDFHGDGWLDTLPIEVDVLVDGSITGVLKPDPRAFGFAVEAMGLPPEDLVFADDQPGNVAGARRFGLVTVHFDVTDPKRSTAEVRAALDRR